MLSSFSDLNGIKQNGRTRFSECCLQARRGEFTDTVQTAIIPALLDGGLVFILRWSLDDNTETTIAAAVNCFHSMLVSEQDEVCVFDFEVVQRSNSKSRAKALNFCNVETMLVQSHFVFRKKSFVNWPGGTYLGWRGRGYLPWPGWGTPPHMN